MSTRNKNVRQDVAFRVVSGFTDTTPLCSVGNVVRRQGKSCVKPIYYISVVRLFGLLFFKTFSGYIHIFFSF